MPSSWRWRLGIRLNCKRRSFLITNIYSAAFIYKASIHQRKSPGASQRLKSKSVQFIYNMKCRLKAVWKTNSSRWCTGNSIQSHWWIQSPLHVSSMIPVEKQCSQLVKRPSRLHRVIDLENSIFLDVATAERLLVFCFWLYSNPWYRACIRRQWRGKTSLPGDNMCFLVIVPFYSTIR